LLKTKFPGLAAVELPAYGINYRTGNMAGQLPKIYQVFCWKHHFTQNLITIFNSTAHLQLPLLVFQ